MPAVNEDNLVTVGQVVNTHGHKGEVRVWPLTDFPERFQEGASLVFVQGDKTRQLSIGRARVHKNMMIIQFAEISDMDSAETLKGGLLKVSKNELVELPENTYFVFEIIGMAVETIDKKVLGRVKDVIQTGANDIYLISGPEKDYMVPAVKEFIQQIDRENGLITINPPEGLLDL